jgi:hypothetical protein
MNDFGLIKEILSKSFYMANKQTFDFYTIKEY